jgi:hypothetical protein
MSELQVTINNKKAKTRLSAIPGNLKLQPSFNSYGPYMDGRSFSDGSIKSKKGKFLGRYTKTIYLDGRVEIVLTF